MCSFELEKLRILLKLAHCGGDISGFCKEVGINSERNLQIYFRRFGVIDGHLWSYGELANEYDISRPRVVQICQRTNLLLKRYFDKQGT